MSNWGWGIAYGIVVAILLLTASFHLGAQTGAKEPLKYTKNVELTKVIGWCVVASVEQMGEMGADADQIKSLLPEMTGDCEDRWLAFSKRWEREEI